MEKTESNVELELFIVRHAESMGNVGYKEKMVLDIQQTNDAVLTEKGIVQAMAVGEFLSSVEFDEIYTSPLLRALQTTAEIAKRQPNKKAIRIFPELCEIGIELEYSGLGLEQICEIYPESSYVDGVLQTVPYLCHEKHDEHEKIYFRAKNVMEYIRSRHKNGEKVLIVSHGAIITNFLFNIMGFGRVEPSFDLDFYNTGITKIVFYKHGTNKWGDTVIKCINDTSHYLLMK